MADTPVSFLLGVVPVLLLLAALHLLDAYRLVSRWRVLRVIAAGGLAALLCLWLSRHLWWLARESSLSTYWLLPLVEEVAKSLVILLLFRLHRIGFLVDAAILGFAVGAGFAIVENLYYAAVLEPLPAAVWLVRGFGTALMHGGVSAIFSLLTQLLTERNRRGLHYCLPGLALAVGLHWLFNRFYLSPLIHTLLVVSVLPALLLLVFQRSALAMQRWLRQGLDGDMELLQLIRSGEFGNSRLGGFLSDLIERFDAIAVVDMLCYLRLYTELSLRAKGVLMMREQGFDVPGGAGLEGHLRELAYLERSIGPVGMLALRPLLARDRRDRWQIRLVSELGKGKNPG
ncbi:PrsW family glutamic-type intramembrane protease [Parahaliea aestuarii]|uniref:PrsW family intramembrane metalloprotease n=1 Tax=Parahaliea aestuarii TaxID=1852021 RepID=A0A5C9A3B4_9GAMM|nr:PrsW family glutamic-type intramembrane protease [Parahaliea aestuarii]TXS94432.1 PrsW family intramembrane metalloprotease [Parahaliea aestuarii]